MAMYVVAFLKVLAPYPCPNTHAVRSMLYYDSPNFRRSSALIPLVQVAADDFDTALFANAL